MEEALGAWAAPAGPACTALSGLWRQLAVDRPRLSLGITTSAGGPTRALSFSLLCCLLPSRPAPPFVFLDVFSTGVFSIWNLFYPLSGSIDPLSHRPPASWCPLFTVTQAVIACRSLLIIPMLAAVFPAEAATAFSCVIKRPQTPPGLLLRPDNSLRGMARKTEGSRIFLLTETYFFGWGWG